MAYLSRRCDRTIIKGHLQRVSSPTLRCRHPRCKPSERFLARYGTVAAQRLEDKSRSGDIEMGTTRESRAHICDLPNPYGTVDCVACRSPSGLLVENLNSAERRLGERQVWQLETYTFRHGRFTVAMHDASSRCNTGKHE
jgi:hypothetical protein